MYINSREDARTLASELGCESFYSDSGSMEEKEQVTARWRDGVHRVIVATSAFGAGVDYAHVRVVIHLDMPRDAINFSQEVGRAGRDGHSGHSLVLLPSRHTPVSDEMWERQRFSTPVRERVMQRYVGENRCLWATLSRFVDGPDQMQYCVADLECSVCLDRGFFRVGQEVDETRYWDGLPSTRETEDASKEEENNNSEDESEEEVVGGRGTLEAGSQRLRQAERHAEEGRSQYLERCARWKGTCFVCLLLHGGRGHDHDLDSCRGPHKGSFLEAKKLVMQDTRRRGGWMKAHTACWKCGQLPTICDGLSGRRGCEYRDMVLPGTWAMFHMRNLWGRSIQEVSGQLGGFADEAAWMAWLGEEVEVFGERGIQAVRMFTWTLSRLDDRERQER